MLETILQKNFVVGLTTLYEIWMLGWWLSHPEEYETIIIGVKTKGA
jgi:hypothetical protein